MTDQDKRPFMDELKRLGVAFGTEVDSALASVYWDGLRDLDLVTFREASRDCILQLKWFPKVLDLRDAEFGVRARTETAHRKQLMAGGPAPDDRHCTACEDTGFTRDLTCPGDGRCHVGNCGHQSQGGPHAYTRKCFCRATNPVLLKQREYLVASAKRHSQPER